MFQNYHSRQNRKENIMTPPPCGKTISLDSGNMILHLYCLSLYRILRFHPVSDVTSG